MDNNVKILFCGDVEGKINAVFKRVEGAQKKGGPFSMMFCVGNFFGINNKEFEAYKSGEKKVPIPTYILGANKEDHTGLFKDEDYELCPNLYYLGKRGLYTTSQGLKIAYMSGTSSSVSDKKGYNFTSEDVEALRDTCFRGNANMRGVDVLLTSQWPKDVCNNSPKNIAVQPDVETNLNSLLAIYLKPRYHISGLTGMFYERAPYRTITVDKAESELEIVTRFIGLARVGNPNKEKFMYAVNLTPLDKMPISQLLERTTDETACPYNLFEIEQAVFNRKRRSNAGQQYFYDMTAQNDDKGNKKHQKKHVEFDQSKCWFCLASVNVEKHLIITVGEHNYLTLAKGGIVDEHFLICPIEHVQNALAQSEESQLEIKRFKEAVKIYYKSKEMVPVFFERNYKTSHMQINAIPITPNATREIVDIFREEGSGNGFELQEMESHNRLDQVLKPNSPYFVVELPNGTVLYTSITGKHNFPLHFGREVLASGPILNLPDRVDWQSCVTSKEQEEDIVGRIRKEFQPFDFTEEDI